MAKAYKKTVEGGRQLYCSNCDEWDDYDNFSKDTFYKGSGDCWELAGEDWWSDCTSSTFYIHSNCDYNAAGEDSTPDARASVEVWVCGECKAEYEEAEYARDCCL